MNRPKFFLKKYLLLKKNAKLVLNGKTRTSFTIIKTSREDFVTGVSHRMISQAARPKQQSKGAYTIEQHH